MRQGKRPTVRQKKFLKEKRLNPDNWLVITDNKCQMTVVHRDTNTVKMIEK